MDTKKIMLAACGGKLSWMCCLTVEQMLELRDLTEGASVDDIRWLRLIACGCDAPATVKPGETPPDGSACSGSSCGCTPALKELCADSTKKAKLIAYAAGLSALVAAAAPTILTPGGAAVVAGLKDYTDALRSLASTCLTGTATRDDVMDFCGQHAAARQIQSYLPGASTILAGIETLIAPVVQSCCKDWDKAVPVQEGKYANDWASRPQDTSSGGYGQDRTPIIGDPATSAQSPTHVASVLTALGLRG